MLCFTLSWMDDVCSFIICIKVFSSIQQIRDKRHVHKKYSLDKVEGEKG